MFVSLLVALSIVTCPLSVRNLSGVSIKYEIYWVDHQLIYGQPPIVASGDIIAEGEGGEKVVLQGGVYEIRVWRDDCETEEVYVFEISSGMLFLCEIHDICYVICVHSEFSHIREFPRCSTELGLTYFCPLVDFDHKQDFRF